MKTTDFIAESIGTDADAMHQDHEVQLARQECYNAAKDAIALHKILAAASEEQGLEGWISEKLTLAADYLKTVKEHLEYNQLEHSQSLLPEFTFEAAEAQYQQGVAEGSLNELDQDTLQSYADKSKRDYNRMNRWQKDEFGTTHRDTKKTDPGHWSTKHLDKRKAGLDRATARGVTPSKPGAGKYVSVGDQMRSDSRGTIGGGLREQGVAEGKKRVSEMTAGGTGAGGFATGPAGGGTFKKTTGVPKKVKNTMKRVAPKLGKGIY